jgi:hypothetical protein
MALSDALEKLGRTIFEAPFTGRSLVEKAPELEEIRLAVIDAVKAKSHRVGRARVFSYDLIRIHLRGIPAEQASAFESGFLAEFLAQDLRAGLARSSFRFPADVQVELRTAPQLPGPGEEFVWIETALREVAPMKSEQGRRRASRLIVVQGAAQEPEVALNKIRTNVGRNVDVYRTEGPSRKNDLAFVEDTEINRTVSREHAHIRMDRKTGEHRIFNDRWYKAGANPDAQCGLWIIRDGLSLPVHRGARGVVLQAGDEIHLGRAVVKFASR